MELPNRGRLSHDVPHWLPNDSFYFVTINCEPRGQNHLCRNSPGTEILAAAAHNHQKQSWRCRIMLLMPDHLHGIISFPREPSLKEVVGNWKKYLARKFGITWQRDFFDHRLRGDQEEIEKMSYILMNPVRKGLCVRPEDWPWVYRPEFRQDTLEADHSASSI